ncbi:short chain dehydrogenase/reductase SDR [Glonium stellatum]|uniref:Short chain dehydrogenase/reductase SDR n=1 Tax=Glonium stellatum TaxID=574774 RepID=A0A8E2JS65_9PEZI|nr:short chain dehydrogenase/reductase SDR [Glonium stellatum]
MPTYFLTGANRGLGLEFVRQLSLSKDNTIIACVRSLQGDLSDLKSLSSQHDAAVHILECDNSSLPSISALRETVAEALGGKKINYLINNAGINATSADTSLSMDPASLQKHMAVNVLGPAKVVETLQHLLAQDSVVVNMTSGLGSISLSHQITKCCTYSISKAALNMLTVHQAHDLAGIAVVICMDPGWVKTRMGGEGAVLEPEESIGGMLKVFHDVGKGDTAKFYRYSGKEAPW